MIRLYQKGYRNSLFLIAPHMKCSLFLKMRFPEPEASFFITSGALLFP